jgi:hypothetical protein
METSCVSGWWKMQLLHYFTENPLTHSRNQLEREKILHGRKLKWLHTANSKKWQHQQLIQYGLKINILEFFMFAWRLDIFTRALNAGDFVPAPADAISAHNAVYK